MDKGKWIFTSCTEHPGCTEAFEFTATADDSQLVPIPERVRRGLAASDFAQDVCIGSVHLDGALSVRRSQP